MAYDHNKYTSQYAKDNYDKISIKLPKGSREKLRQLATDLDMRDNKGLISVTRLIINALEKTYKIDLSNPKQK